MASIRAKIFSALTKSQRVNKNTVTGKIIFITTLVCRCPGLFKTTVNEAPQSTDGEGAAAQSGYPQSPRKVRSLTQSL